MNRKPLFVLFGIFLSLPVTAAQYEKTERFGPYEFCDVMLEYLQSLPPDRPLMCRLFSDPDAPYESLDWKKFPIEGNERLLWRVGRAQHDDGGLRPEDRDDPNAVFEQWLAEGNLDKWLKYVDEPAFYLADIDVDGYGERDTLAAGPVGSVERCENFLLQQGRTLSPALRAAYVPESTVNDVLASDPLDVPMYDLGISGYPVQYKGRVHVLSARWTKHPTITKADAPTLDNVVRRAFLSVKYHHLTERGDRRRVLMCRFTLRTPDVDREEILRRQIGADIDK